MIQAHSFFRRFGDIGGQSHNKIRLTVTIGQRKAEISHHSNRPVRHDDPKCLVEIPFLHLGQKRVAYPLSIVRVNAIEPFFRSAYVLVLKDEPPTEIQVSERQAVKLREWLTELG